MLFRSAGRVRRWLGRYEEQRDLIAIGAYKAGSDRGLDEAIARQPGIEAFLRQGSEEVSSIETTQARLGEISR